MYADDESYHDGHGRVYERCGIDESEGCLVVLRPDGYVSVIRDLNERDELVAFFDRLNSRLSLVKTIISGDANVRASL